MAVIPAMGPWADQGLWWLFVAAMRSEPVRDEGGKEWCPVTPNTSTRDRHLTDLWSGTEVRWRPG